ncbi:MAG: DUF1573 domain-containing protein [Bacteroidetes bacterium]|nr:DUF1573 domain-containing protein [Bacteroidota bacterium]
MKKSIIIIFFLLFSLSIFAQKKATIQFDSTEFNFGKFKEEKGKVEHIFKFKNTGNDTLKLLDVKASCGCTSPVWSKKAILPGESGIIKAVFDAKNRPGIFRKSITVQTNATNDQVVLIIAGDVIPREKSIRDIYPTAIGNLRFKSSVFNLQKILNTEIKTDTITIYNDWEKPMKIKFKDLPEFIKLKAIPSKLDPGKVGKIIIKYDGSKKNDFGIFYDRITLLTNDSTDSEKIYNISAHIIEDFSKMTPSQVENAPKIELESEVFDFGTIKQGAVIKKEIKISNKGKSDLIIRKYFASCGCTIVNIEKTTLKPNESSIIKIEYNSVSKKGKEEKTITIISNDPRRMNLNITVKGIVNGE